MSKNDEFCVKNEELCIKNEELCIVNEELCIKNDEFCRVQGNPRGWGEPSWVSLARAAETEGYAQREAASEQAGSRGAAELVRVCGSAGGGAVSRGVQPLSWALQ